MHIYQRWWLGLLVLLVAACGTAASPSHAQQIMQQAHQAPLRDATFAVTFTADGASNTGSGILTTTPNRYQLTLLHTTPNEQIAHLLVMCNTTGKVIALFTKVVGDELWSTPNDGEDGTYDNFDTDILNYDQLRTVTLVGSTMLQGEAAWHLHATATIQLYDTDGILIPITGTEDLWLRQSDAFPLMVQKSFSGAAQVSDGTTEQMQLQAAYQFHAWNTGATITLPDESQTSASG